MQFRDELVHLFIYCFDFAVSTAVKLCKFFLYRKRILVIKKCAAWI